MIRVKVRPASPTVTGGRSLFAAHSVAPDVADVVRDVEASAAREPLAAALVFASRGYPFDALASGLRAVLDAPVYGCTTAGAQSLAGPIADGVVVVGFPARLFRVGALPIALDPFDREATAVRLASVRAHLGVLSFGVLLIDGLSRAEERTVSALKAELPGVPLVGGSAGDGLHFARTLVHDGVRARPGQAVLLLVETALPVRTFAFQHFQPTGRRFVVTGARPEARTVTEIDGRPAAEAYAELLGLDAAALGPDVFARHPLLLKMGGRTLVRSLQRAEPDGSLVFYCAVDRGLVLTLGEPGDILASTEAHLAALEGELGGLSSVLAFECIHRRLEVEGRGLVGEMDALQRRHHVVGFATYGEQCGPLHLTQTLTGVALGALS